MYVFESAYRCRVLSLNEYRSIQHVQRSHARIRCLCCCCHPPTPETRKWAYIVSPILLFTRFFLFVHQAAKTDWLHFGWKRGYALWNTSLLLPTMTWYIARKYATTFVVPYSHCLHWLSGQQCSLVKMSLYRRGLTGLVQRPCRCLQIGRDEASSVIWRSKQTVLFCAVMMVSLLALRGAIEKQTLPIRYDYSTWI